MKVTFQSNRGQVEAYVNDAIDHALDRIGDRAVELAQNLATIDTGNMRASLTHQRYDEQTEIVGTSNQQAPYKPVDYAPYVELGTRRQRAQPFLRPAIENHMQEYKEIWQGELSKIE